VLQVQHLLQELVLQVIVRLAVWVSTYREKRVLIALLELIAILVI